MATVPCSRESKPKNWGIAHVLVPKVSPAFSALGALTALPSIDEERSYLVPAGAADVLRLRALWEDLDREAERHLAPLANDSAERGTRFQVNLRYPGQNWALTVDAAQVEGQSSFEFCDDSLLPSLVERFHARHELEYGHRRAAEEPEITGVRMVSSVPVPTPNFGGGFETPPFEAKALGQRRAHLGLGYQDTEVFRGEDLEPGARVRAPAIIEENFTTIVVYPGWEARMDDAGDLHLFRE